METQSILAVAYVRVSGTGQEEGHGWERQEDNVRFYADREHITIVRVYHESHTGTETDRPAFLEMLSDMMGTDIKTVIIEGLDRLARDLLVQCQLIAKLVESGITLLAANTGENVTEATQGDPMRKALIGIQGIFAELDKSLLVRKLRKARDAKKQKSGRCEGKKPYGGHPGHPEEISILHSMIRMSRDNELSSTEIAISLNTDGIRTRKGSLWNSGTVCKILKRTVPHAKFLGVLKLC